MAQLKPQVVAVAQALPQEMLLHKTQVQVELVRLHPLQELRLLVVAAVAAEL